MEAFQPSWRNGGGRSPLSLPLGYGDEPSLESQHGFRRTPGSYPPLPWSDSDAASLSGITPLEWMLSVVRDENADVKRRDEMARTAAPYMHPRLAAVEHLGKDDSPPHPPIDVQITYVAGGPDPDLPTVARDLTENETLTRPTATCSG
jgi:hypothetical protein